MCPGAFALNEQFTSVSNGGSCLDYCVCLEACCDDDDTVASLAGLLDVTGVSGCADVLDWCDYSTGDSLDSFPAASIQLQQEMQDVFGLQLGATAAMVVSNCPVACGACLASSNC